MLGKLVIRAIVVDDEALARSELIYLLSELGGVDVVAEVANVRQAIEKLKSHPCDVVFLDINMPEATGLQLAEAMRRLRFSPAVVFVTAYDNYAVEAFKVNAIDYLVKPVELERLETAVSRVREQVDLHFYAKNAERIPASKGKEKTTVGINEILYAEAQHNYTILHTSSGRYFSTLGFSHLEKQLENYGFLRSHRGYLVNLSRIKEVESNPGGTLTLTIDNVEEKIPVSRRRASEFKQALGIR